MANETTYQTRELRAFFYEEQLQAITKAAKNLHLIPIPCVLEHTLVMPRNDYGHCMPNWMSHREIKDFHGVGNRFNAVKIENVVGTPLGYICIDVNGNWVPATCFPANEKDPQYLVIKKLREKLAL